MPEPYDVGTCAGWQDGSWSALGEPRCARCGWSWSEHGRYGRPRPDICPPDVDIDEPWFQALWDDED
jgi:hypothetical protein